MSDLVLDNIANPSRVSVMNDNFDKIEDKVNDDVLQNKDGHNTMLQDLDMDSNQILNLPKAVNDTDPVRLIDLEEMTGLGPYTISISNGGTGATTASGARANLGVDSTGEVNAKVAVVDAKAEKNRQDIALIKEIDGVGESFQTRQAVEALYKAQGYNNIFFFEDGFTYTESNDVGIYEDGTAWTYADTGALPVTIAAGTVPSDGVYTRIASKVIEVSDVNELVNLTLDDSFIGSVIKTSAFNLLNQVGWEDKKFEPLGGAEYRVMSKAAADSEGVSYWISGDLEANYAFLVDSDYVLLLNDSQEVELEQLGALGDGVQDTYEILDLAINNLRYDGSGFYIGGRKIKLRDSATYYVSRYINIKTVTHIEGSGTGLPSNLSTPRILFANGSTGFIVHRYNTIDNTVEESSTTAADSSSFVGFTILGGRGESDAIGGHAIWMRARAIVEKVGINNFEGNGIHIVAASNGGNSIQGNANNFVLNTLRITGCDSGVWVEGYDANAGKGYSVDSSSNRSWGIVDKSFLGCYWFGCHVASNGSGGGGVGKAYCNYNGEWYHAIIGATEEELATSQPDISPSVWYEGIKQTSFSVPWVQGQEVGTFKEGGGYGVEGLNNRAYFSGCYSEGGQGVTQGSQHSLFTGGFLVEVPVVGSAWARGEFGALRVGGALKVEQVSSEGNYVSTSLGGSPSNGDILRWDTTIDSAESGTWRLKGSSSGGFKIDNSNSGSRIPFEVGGTDDGRYAYRLKFNSVRKTSGSSDAIHGIITWTSATGVNLPTSGEFVRGDRYETLRPLAGDYVGLVCTTGGEAGSTAVFKKYGQTES